MPPKGSRILILTCGKATALYVLLMSLSGRLSVVIGFDYMNAISFAVCGIVAFGFFFVIRFIKNVTARLIFACAVFVLIAVWCLLLIYLTWFLPTGTELSTLVLLCYAGLGRVATLFINIQWNFHFSLNSVQQSAKFTVVSVLFAILLYLSSFAADGTFSAFILLGSILTSGILNVIMEVKTYRNAYPLHSIECIEKSDAQSPVAPESYVKTRIRYFGTRIIYGAVLGFMVSTVSVYTIVSVAQTPIILLVSALGIVAAVGVFFFSSSEKGNLYLVTMTPIMISLTVFVCFYSNDFLVLAPLFAMLVEVAWTTQNLFQLPTYRRITGMQTSTFAYYEYAAQIIPFYFVAWITASNLNALTISSSSILPGIIGAICLVVLIGFSVFAMVWHIFRYYPRHTIQRPLAQSSDRLDALNIVHVTQLTPREKDVFELLAEGYSRPYIAKTLYISVDTVKVHAKHIYRKLHINSQDELIELARQVAL